MQTVTTVPALLDEPSSHFVSAASLRRRLVWFDKLRWAAVVGALCATAVATRVLPSSLPTGELLAVTGVLAVLNTVYTIRNRRVPPTRLPVELMHVKLQMAGDLVLLTVMLNLSGGIENPLLYLYLVHVIIASLLFKGRDVFHIAGLAIVLFTADVAGEYFHILPHHHLLSAGPITHEPPFILLTLGAFCLVQLVAAYIGSTIMKHNRAIKDELVDRQKELLAADRAKLEFFRFVTHEIKSPVATAQSAVDAVLELKGLELPEKVRDLLERAVNRLGHALTMIKDLAEFTRGGDVKRETMETVDLNVLIARITDQLSEEASRRNITVTMDLPPDQPYMLGNPGMLQKIVSNLVSNAVRYSEDGGQVNILLRMDPGVVVLTVSDRGIGIAPEDQGRVFDEFYRTSQAQQMSNLGTGLGLPIVRRFTEQMGGTIELQSEPGRGSTFTLRLPRQDLPSGSRETS
ncbi:hypothetical protein CO151_08580 [bacterium CG_4_9_14_3_um_filter_65_15]|nr:MAG: hypothetical protein CO151_08580 [bacterium CG_4_9_14_3_um_filter_65_15]